MKSRLALVLLSGVLGLGGVACASSSSEASCVEWRNVYNDGSGIYSSSKVIGQKCVRWSDGSTEQKSASTPTSSRFQETTTSGCIRTIPNEDGSGYSIDYNACD